MIEAAAEIAGLFQSTLPMRGATETFPFGRWLSVISIHTPHAGSDTVLRLRGRCIYHFNPHSPCGERLRYVDGI